MDKEYMIVRQTGVNHDYLIGFDPVWGTICAGSGALRFPSLSAARAALRKCRRSYRGYNGRRIVNADARNFRITQTRLD